MNHWRFLIIGFTCMVFLFAARSASAQVATATVTANPTTINSGGSTTLTWSSTNATSCTSTSSVAGYNNWNSGTLSGSVSISNITQNVTFDLSCTGTKGTANASATVTIAAASPTPTPTPSPTPTPPPAPPPTATLTANPTSVTSGGSTALNWTSQNAVSCTSYPTNWSKGALTGGAVVSGITATNNQFSLVCFNSAGDDVQVNVTVTVTPATPSPTPPPATSSGTPWFQVQGQVTSNASGDRSIYAVLPNAIEYFNKIAAIVTGAGRININRAANPDPSPVPNQLAPTPAPNLENYSDNYAGQLDYATLEARIPASPAPQVITGSSFFNTSLTSGVYQSNGNLTILNSTNMDPDATPPNPGTINVPSGTYVTIFVAGKTAVQSNIIVEPGGFFAVISQNDINIDKAVSQVDGIYFTDQKLCTQCSETSAPQN